VFYASVKLDLSRESLAEDFREEEQSDRTGENCTVKSSVIFVFQKMLLGYFKLWRMRWAGHVARMAQKRYLCRFFFGYPEGTSVDGSRPILKIILKK